MRFGQLPQPPLLSVQLWLGAAPPARAAHISWTLELERFAIALRRWAPTFGLRLCVCIDS